MPIFKVRILQFLIIRDDVINYVIFTLVHYNIAGYSSTARAPFTLYVFV